MRLASSFSPSLRLVSLFALSLVVSSAHSQGFNSGSDGSYRSAISADGNIHITSGTVTLDMPPDGIFKCKSITIDKNSVLKFNRNALNTPVYLLATGDIIIQGQINVSGNTFPADPDAHTGGLGGPGGFDGGEPGWGSIPPGAGMGPGAGKGATAANPGGQAAYATPASSNNPNNGSVYGSQLLMPLIGGSGGGGGLGNPGYGGGGGGGAILLASNTSITIPVGGAVIANSPSGVGGSGAGSAGAIRLISPVVSGGGSVQTIGFNNLSNGRIRIDTLDRTNLDLGFGPSQVTIGRYLKVFPDVTPKLNIVKVTYKDAQGVDHSQDIAENATGPVSITLPFNAPTHIKVTIQPRGLTGSTPINLVTTPDSGSPTDHLLTLNGNTLTVIDADIPANTRTRLLAFTK